MRNPSSILRIALGLLALLFVGTMTRAEEAMAKEKKPSKETLAKYDANKDGVLDDAEKAAMKADVAAKAKTTREANLSKYDLNKDGKLDEAEKAAMKADQDAVKAVKRAEKEAAKEAKQAAKESSK